MKINKRTAGLPLICLICGDVARGINFDLMTCMSCKAFFRRHAVKSSYQSFRCALDAKCEINQRTRGACSACRLKKCFQLGMNPELIRNTPTSLSSRALSSHKQQSLPSPQPLSLLQHDRSTMTTDDWTLLSNIINAYDMAQIVPRTKSLLQRQTSLLPKLRSKSVVGIEMIKIFYLALQPFVERCPHFHQLPSDARRTLFEHNSEGAGSFHSFFLIRQLNAFDCVDFVTAGESIYGGDFPRCINRFVSQLEPNGILVQLMFFILAFSSNCSIITADRCEQMRTSSDSHRLVQIQNRLVTMFWKYLLYQYGFSGAVQRLNSMIKYLLHLIGSTAPKMNSKHSTMVDSLVQQTTDSFNNDNETMVLFSNRQ